jgi:5-methylcytosine-specific restriction endonuclease McrA
MPTGVYIRKAVPMYSFHCASCGDEKTVKLSQAKKVVPRFCSSKCFGVSVSEPEPNRSCAHCGARFRAKRETVKFCSKECVSASRRKPGEGWNDPAYIREYHRQYAHRLREAGGFDRKRIKVKKYKKAASMEQVNSLFSKAKGFCVYCGKASEKLTIDHVSPISAGGRHSARNIIPCCKSCNSSKGVKPVEEWLYEKFGVDGVIRAYLFLAAKEIDLSYYEVAA